MSLYWEQWNKHKGNVNREFTTKTEPSAEENKQYTLPAVQSFIKHTDHKWACAAFSERVRKSYHL